MRRFLPLLLMAPLAFGERLIEVSFARYVGTGTDIAAVAAGQGYYPAIQTQRAGQRGHWRCLNLGLQRISDTALPGDAAGMGRHGAAVAVGTLRDGEVSVIELSLPGRKASVKRFGNIAIRDLPRARVLRVTSTPLGPLVIVRYSDGLFLATPREGGEPHTNRIPVPGTAVIAASDPFPADGDARLDLFAVGSGSQMIRLEQRGVGFVIVKQTQFQAGPFRPKALAGEGRHLWVAGQRGARGSLARFDTAAFAPGRAGAAGAVKPADVIDFKTGSIDHVRYLDANLLAVGGTQDGRAWVGVVRLGPRPTLIHERYLPGSAVTALGVNPARTGWTLGASTNEKTFHVLLMPGDKALAKDWDAFAPKPPPVVVEEPPEEIPVPEPRRPEGRRFDPRGRRGGADEGTAILARVQANARRRVDTEIILVYEGRQRCQVRVDFVGDDGKVAHTVAVSMSRDERVRISAASEFARRRVPQFDGYVRITGPGEKELIVEGVIRGARGIENVAAHWR